MRIVWKDSKPKGYKPVRYRKHTLYGSPEGWTTSLPGDNNLYATHYDALNAIDNALGGTGIRGSAKRMKNGINIIGQKNMGEI